MSRLESIQSVVESVLGTDLLGSQIAFNEVTCEVKTESIVSVCETLRDTDGLGFEQMIDLCGVDYSEYGAEAGEPWSGARYAVVYHLQSVANNQRIRLRAMLDDDFPQIDSVTGVWAGANWFEREAFDLFGILFGGHPDMRRLLTDYGFIGHPFRKDFPLSGHVEMRYDEEKGRVIYQPVTVEPRVLVPRSAR